MTGSLYDASGNSKYLVTRERAAFVRTSHLQAFDVFCFCMTLALTGARLSEVLALTPASVDRGNETIIIRTLKQRQGIAFRAVPVPDALLIVLSELSLPRSDTDRLWPFGRTTAWKIVKLVMRNARIPAAHRQPKALRHAFAVDAVLNGVPLNIVQKWMGHARLETTAIYANVLGKEERALARRVWRPLESVISRR